MESGSNAIDAFELSIKGDMATVPKEIQQSYHPAWQCWIQLTFVSIDGTRPGIY